jgi:hypothetical protein
MTEHVAIAQARAHLVAAYEKLRRKTLYPVTGGSLDEFGAVTAAERYLRAYRRFWAVRSRYDGFWPSDGKDYYRAKSDSATPTSTPAPAAATTGSSDD